MSYDPGPQKGGKGSYADDNAPWMQQKQETEQVVLQHPESTPWYFAQDFSWWWTGVFVPIVIAWIVNRAIKHNKNQKVKKESK